MMNAPTASRRPRDRTAASGSYRRPLSSDTDTVSAAADTQLVNVTVVTALKPAARPVTVIVDGTPLP